MMHKILIIEDQIGDSLQNLLKRIFPVSQIRLSTDGASGILTFSQFKPDLVITDWNMPPGPHGGDVAKEIQNIDKNAKIILWSGSHPNTFEGYEHLFNQILPKATDLYTWKTTIESQLLFDLER